MRKLSIFTGCLLLVTTTTLFAQPQVYYRQSTPTTFFDTETNAFNFPQDISSVTYDDILNFLAAIESGELEEKCTEKDLDKVNQFTALLAREGILPDGTEEEVEEDIEALLSGEENPFEYVFDTGNYKEYMIVPALYKGHSNHNAILCKSWGGKNGSKSEILLRSIKKSSL